MYSYLNSAIGPLIFFKLFERMYMLCVPSLMGVLSLLVVRALKLIPSLEASKCLWKGVFVLSSKLINLSLIAVILKELWFCPA